jgi:putative ABC transport system permease protein
MKLHKAFVHALEMVLHAKVRSWLTILGIVIGVAAVISIVSLGESLKSDMNSRFGELGGDLLTLRAGASRAMMFGPGRDFVPSGGTASDEEEALERTDLQVLKGISDIKLIDTQISGRVEMYFVAEKGTVSVTGVDPATWAQITTLKIADGRMLGPADTNVIVIGGRIADGFFDKQLGVNQILTIEDKLFRIVGILDDSSNNVYMPINMAYEVLEDSEKGVYDTIIIKVKDEDNVDQAMSVIERRLQMSRHVTNVTQDFTLTSNKESNETRQAMQQSMTTFLTAIAAVALLVGAVGVANTMFTSVLEKTKEIGIMKAIGARNSDILAIFLLNAGLIGFIGGLIGIFFGIVLSSTLPGLMGQSGGMLSRLASGENVISLPSILIALGISVFIGMVAGAVPAYQASKLKPVDALRYE